MRNLDNVIGDVDDVSNTEAALTDFDCESEGGSRYGVDETAITLHSNIRQTNCPSMSFASKQVCCTLSFIHFDICSEYVKSRYLPRI